jgi:hypothetical protein
MVPGHPPTRVVQVVGADLVAGLAIAAASRPGAALASLFLFYDLGRRPGGSTTVKLSWSTRPRQPFLSVLASPAVGRILASDLLRPR